MSGLTAASQKVMGCVPGVSLACSVITAGFLSLLHATTILRCAALPNGVLILREMAGFTLTVKNVLSSGCAKQDPG